MGAGQKGKYQIKTCGTRLLYHNPEKRCRKKKNNNKENTFTLKPDQYIGILFAGGWGGG